VRANAQPASIFLRIPLAWLHSTTYAFFPDESPALIRRSYTPRYAPSSKRFFCGVCADLLTIWSEASPEDAAYAHVNWHTLELGSRETLGELGVLPDEYGFDEGIESRPEPEASRMVETAARGEQSSLERGGTNDGTEYHRPTVVQTRVSGPTADLAPSTVFSSLLGRDVPWFESMLEGSPLGRMRRRTGGGVSSDGRTRIEWEIVEYGANVGQGNVGQSPQVGSKRRLGDDAEADDVTMR
jgi:hypothetical protein